CLATVKTNQLGYIDPQQALDLFKIGRKYRKIAMDSQEINILQFAVLPGRFEAHGPTPADVHQILKTRLNTHFLIDLTHHIFDRLARPIMASHRDIEAPGPGVLACRATLKEDLAHTVLRASHDPEVKRPVPVTVTMDFGATLDF